AKCSVCNLTSLSCICVCFCFIFFFSSRIRHTRLVSDWSSDVCSSDLFHGALRRELRMPYGGRYTEARRETVTELRGERDLRHQRSEERRVGKECRSRWAAYH